MSLTIKVSGFKQLTKKWSSASPKVKTIVTKSLMGSGFRIESSAKQKAPVGVDGRLRSSIMTKPFKLGGNIGVKIGPTVNYGIYVEKGTGAHRPPVEPIKRWSKKKGIPWFLVWKKIASKGTKKHPFMEPAYRNNLSQIKGDFSKMLKLITKLL